MTFTLGQLIFWIVLSATVGMFAGALAGMGLMCIANAGSQADVQTQNLASLDDQIQRSLRKEIDEWDPFSPPAS